MPKIKERMIKMKLYQKPDVDILGYQQKETLASLGEWLESGDGQAYQDAGITTYVLQS